MKKALLIGINYYSLPDIKLNGCIYDIINMRNMLIDAYDYSNNNIIMLRDDVSNSSAQPTKANIMNSMMQTNRNSIQFGKPSWTFMEFHWKTLKS